eukprot:CAMPEP_0113910260 /NCGR_PEP_ID=MMETSP0780_2-20120614/27413_1 /TAXON_ID=652834 /ORGANISM="Palpitomonas bilix" /LENGTH=226 /DNA_ID=CAMNT_0000906369 /DNA_START=239 /DNA_END=916 /DNA_ORIENTATION=- /assembly_acc=CAM_ASM_000599
MSSSRLSGSFHSREVTPSPTFGGRRSAMEGGGGPSVSFFTPSSGPVEGGTVVTVELAKYPRVDVASNLSVRFGEKAAQVDRILHSDERYTKFIARVPPHDNEEGGPATVSISLNTRPELPSLSFSYRYEVSEAAITSISPSSGSTDGGELLSFRVRGLGRVASTSDLIIKFDDTPASVERIVSTQNPTAPGITEFTVVAPRLPDDDGEGARDVTVTVARVDVSNRL